VITPKSFKLDESRQNLYFGKYKYRCSLTIEGIQYFKRTKDTHNLNETIEELSQSGWSRWRKPFYREFTINIKHFIEWRIANEWRVEEFKLVIGEDTVNVYANDVAVANSIYCQFENTDISETMKLSYATIRPDYDEQVIYRVNPRHKYRVYLRSRKYTLEEREELRNFLSQNSVKLSDSLAHWLTNSPSFSWNKNTYWAWDHLCFDYDEEYIVTLLALKFDGVIRKICRIEKK
jgi:hypothetical protein